MKVELYQGLLAINWNLLFSLITVVTLVLILKHFFFDKVRAFMENREQNIIDQLANADEVSRAADEKLAGCDEKISEANAEGLAIIKRAKANAKVQADNILKDANAEAERMIEDSRKQISEEHKAAQKELEREVGNLAILAAEKIMEKNLSEENHHEIIGKIIKDAGETPWRS